MVTAGDLYSVDVQVDLKTAVFWFTNDSRFYEKRNVLHYVCFQHFFRRYQNGDQLQSTCTDAVRACLTVYRSIVCIK